jgi:hypothetical protein
MTRRHRLGNGTASAFPQEDNGALWGSEQGGLRRADPTEPLGGLKVGYHNRERPGLPVLTASQLLDHSSLQRIAGEVIATKTFHGNNLASVQLGAHKTERIVFHQDVPLSVNDLEARPAGRAGYWLSMETSVSRIMILSLTGSTHPKAVHGRTLTVVREALDDSKAWTAVGAVEKRVAITTRARGA